MVMPSKTLHAMAHNTNQSRMKRRKPHRISCYMHSSLSFLHTTTYHINNNMVVLSSHSQFTTTKISGIVCQDGVTEPSFSLLFKWMSSLQTTVLAVTTSASYFSTQPTFNSLTEAVHVYHFSNVQCPLAAPWHLPLLLQALVHFPKKKNYSHSFLLLLPIILCQVKLSFIKLSLLSTPCPLLLIVSSGCISTVPSLGALLLLVKLSGPQSTYRILVFTNSKIA